MAAESSQYFVLRPKPVGLPPELPAEPAGSTGLFVFRNATPAADAREEWHRLIREYGDRIEFAAPVMVDRQGRQMLPTGRMVVEFYNSPTSETLEQLQNAYGLRYLTTNEFKKEQVSFEARDPKAVYPPDLLAKLASDSRVKLAMPETMARYSRL
jgi:hypothetical protein